MVELQGLLGRNYIGRVQRQREGVAAIQSEGVYQAGGIASWEVPPCLLVFIRHAGFAQRRAPTSVRGGVAAVLWI
jgi:hypothetical protein